MSNLTNEDVPRHVCRKIFSVLAWRAKKVEDPRINTVNFLARLGGIAPGIAWEDVALLLKPVERYCDHMNLPLLSVLVVLADEDIDNISFPGEWFDQDGQISGWKFPPDDASKRWYRGKDFEGTGGYFRRVSHEWRAVDIDKEQIRFDEWLDAETGWFEWPSTVAHIGADIDAIKISSPKDGIFSFLGYRVGKANGAPDDDRKDILDWMFHNALPRVNSASYMEEFGKPESPMRLKKMANVLASLARNYSRNMQGNLQDYSVAISHYIMDLDYLYEEYYVKKFGFDKKPEFPWPDLSDLSVEPESLKKSTRRKRSPIKPKGKRGSPRKKPEKKKRATPEPADSAGDKTGTLPVDATAPTKRRKSSDVVLIIGAAIALYLLLR